MAVQIRLMGDPAEVASVMDALMAGEPVTVLSDGSPVRNHRDGGGRMFGMAQLAGQGPMPAPPERRVRSERLDRPHRRGIGR